MKIRVFSVLLLTVLIPALSGDRVDVTITDRVLVPRVGRFGVNLGGWSFWGADQFSSNIVKNPGFEGLIDGAIVMPEHSAGSVFVDSPAWLARPDGFWDGARFAIRSGPDAGREGVIARSHRMSDSGLAEFMARDGDVVPRAGEAAALVKVTENALPTQWWYSKEPGNGFTPELNQRRPGSPGVRSLRIGASGMHPATVSSYFDSMSERAGKLLPLEGVWDLSFWVRLDKGAATLRVIFERQGSSPLLSRDVPLSASWSNVRLTFSGSDDEPPGTVSLRFELAGRPAGEILIDDVDLRRADDTNQPFRHEVVSLLDRLHPAYLRDWQGQLADTMANRAASQFARKSYRYRPGDDSQTDFGYGLGDFLGLCVRVKASPWIIVPTVFNDSDCAGLGDYLSSRPDVAGFPEVLVEFGNENWNPLFRPAGITAPAAHGQASGRCLAAIREHARSIRLKTVTNAQAGYPAGALEFARESRVSDIVAVAPYFFYSLRHGLSLGERIATLFRRDSGMPAIAAAMPAMNKDLAVYEVNLHTVNGDASAAERKPVVAGLPAGSALARNLLDNLALGVRRQLVYSLTGFDSQLTSGQGTVPLWGIARDAGPTSRLRPTGLALELLNEAVAGDMMAVTSRGAPDVSVYAFRSARGWAAVLVSSSSAEKNVIVHLPCQSAPCGTKDSSVRIDRLVSRSPDSTNEDAEEVRVVRDTAPLLGGSISVKLSPWGLAVLLPVQE